MEVTHQQACTLCTLSEFKGLMNITIGAVLPAKSYNLPFLAFLSLYPQWQRNPCRNNAGCRTVVWTMATHQDDDENQIQDRCTSCNLVCLMIFWTRPSFLWSHNIELIKQKMYLTSFHFSGTQVLCEKYTWCITLTSLYTFYLPRLISCWLLAEIRREPLEAVTCVHPGSGYTRNGWFTRWATLDKV